MSIENAERDCANCGKKFNSITSYDFSGRLCNKCHNAKPKQDSQQDSQQDTEESNE